MDFTSHWLRHGMGRPMAGAPPYEQMPSIARADLVQALHLQVRERDHHGAQLRAQLDALKPSIRRVVFGTWNGDRRERSRLAG